MNFKNHFYPTLPHRDRYGVCFTWICRVIVTLTAPFITVMYTRSHSLPTKLTETWCDLSPSQFSGKTEFPKSRGSCSNKLLNRVESATETSGRVLLSVHHRLRPTNHYETANFSSFPTNSKYISKTHVLKCKSKLYGKGVC